MISNQAVFGQTLLFIVTKNHIKINKDMHKAMGYGFCKLCNKEGSKFNFNIYHLEGENIHEYLIILFFFSFITLKANLKPNIIYLKMSDRSN